MTMAATASVSVALCLQRSHTLYTIYTLIKGEDKNLQEKYFLASLESRPLKSSPQAEAWERLLVSPLKIWGRRVSLDTETRETLCTLSVNFQCVVLPGDFWVVVIFRVWLPLHGSYGSSGRFIAGNFDPWPLAERGKAQTVQTWTFTDTV